MSSHYAICFIQNQPMQNCRGPNSGSFRGNFRPHRPWNGPGNGPRDQFRPIGPGRPPFQPHGHPQGQPARPRPQGQNVHQGRHGGFPQQQKQKKEVLILKGIINLMNRVKVACFFLPDIVKIIVFLP